MKYQLLTLIAFACLTGSAWARLGETEEQLIERYGKPISTSKIEASGEQVALEVMQFNKTGFKIEVSLFDGASSQETINKLTGDRIADEEVDILLSVSAQGHKWKELVLRQPHLPLQRQWERDDGAMADYDGHNFRLTSKELISAGTAARKAAHATSLEGF